jgi:hypothetical protein
MLFASNIPPSILEGSRLRLPRLSDTNMARQRVSKDINSLLTHIPSFDVSDSIVQEPMKHIRYFARGNTGMRDGEFREDSDVRVPYFITGRNIFLHGIVVIDEFLSI